MVLNLGGFKFRWEQTNSIDTQTDFGISEQERIQNYPALFSANLGSSALNIEGKRCHITVTNKAH